MVPSTAPLHAGRFVIGTLGKRPVICMQGRLHAYEGNTPQQVAFPIVLMHALGANELVVTNAAGGINVDLGVGDLMLIEDHINLLGANPLAAPDEPALFPRFFDMTQAYSPALREHAAGQRWRAESSSRAACTSPPWDHRSRRLPRYAPFARSGRMPWECRPSSRSSPPWLRDGRSRHLDDLESRRRRARPSPLSHG